MIKAIIIAIVGFFIIIGSLLNASSIHLPTLTIMLVAFGVGFTEPKKGWLVVIFLAIGLFAYGLYFQKLDLEPQEPKLIQFICNIAALPLLFGGFMGRYFKRIFN
jgi:type II secretory pathway component PulF